MWNTNLSAVCDNLSPNNKTKYDLQSEGQQTSSYRRELGITYEEKFENYSKYLPYEGLPLNSHISFP